ncbi:MAG TPA: SprT family zinc-dependent metalloprotease [Azospira sp.]|nr:SprT family zinc-dependent metalloprotease [Azospira sp.]
MSQLQLPLFRDPAERPAADARGAALLLGERLIPYELRRSRRRTIGLTIDHRGLRVGAPLRSSLKDVEKVIRQHQAWVLSKLDDWRQRQPVPLLSISDGVFLPLLGEPSRVGIVTGRAGIAWIDGLLQLSVPDSKDPRPLLERALKERARALFAERLDLYAQALGVPRPPLALSSARTRWGSCSRISGIRLNWRLIHFPLPVIDYVVAHELAHLKEMNHSPRFWSVVEHLYPDYRQARAELKRLAQALPRW